MRLADHCMKIVLHPKLRWTWVICLWLCGLLISPMALAQLNGTSASPAPAVNSQAKPADPQQTLPAWTLDDLKERQNLVDEYRQQVGQQKEQLEKLEGEAVRRLGGLQENLQQTSNTLQSNEAKLKQASVHLEKIQSELVVVEGRYDQRRDSSVERLRFLQKNHKTQNWSTLLQSSSLEDLLDKQYQLKRVYDADRQSLVTLKQDADRINTQKIALEDQKNQISLLLQQLNAQKSEFEQQTKAQRDLVLRLNTDRRALEAAESQLTRDSKSLSALIQQRIALQSTYQNGSPPIPGTGQMILPAQGSVTSPFGWRIHPVLGTSRFHAGLDLGAEEGTPIVAADSGTVILSEWYGGYGNAIIIDHGNNITTLYGHCSQLYVPVGQTVQKGQLIAAVGSTGLSTGPHLHFEVRVQGEPTDPVAYL
jgi:murein DD-endopeptidase MepM/ murein hydrolase activator NlpD